MKSIKANDKLILIIDKKEKELLLAILDSFEDALFQADQSDKAYKQEVKFSFLLRKHLLKRS